jgi:hypothetical protein
LDDLVRSGKVRYIGCTPQGLSAPQPSFPARMNTRSWFERQSQNSSPLPSNMALGYCLISPWQAAYSLVNTGTMLRCQKMPDLLRLHVSPTAI